MSLTTFIKPSYWVEPTLDEVHVVENLLGKKPTAEFYISVIDKQGSPVVIENAPFLKDGTPMPTMYWLIDPELVAQVSRIESYGGVNKAEEIIGLEEISKIHTDYEKKRNSKIPPDYEGHKPSGGVGGTRRGVKCLHAHVANYLVNGNDKVGEWTLIQIENEKNE